MKNRNIKRNILGLMVLASLIGGTTGCTKNQDNNIKYDEIISEALEEYEQRRNELEKEINELEKQKKELENENTFILNDLILGEVVENDGSKELYIFKHYDISSIFFEIHDYFNARINKEHTDYNTNYYYLEQEDTSLLALSLTDEELEKININGGKITTSEADKILERLRKEYHSSSKLELKN